MTNNEFPPFPNRRLFSAHHTGTVPSELVLLIQVPVHTCTVPSSNTPDTGIRYLVQVPVHQASSDPESGRPSARCWGWGKVVRYKTSLPPKKIAQVLKKVDQRTLSLSSTAIRNFVYNRTCF
jgi:hypothetical protein